MSELLSWDGEDLDGPITADDLSRLRAFAARGSNLLLPRAPGRRALAPVMEQLDTSIVWSLTGRTDWAGTPYADREIGVEQNIEHYRTLFTTGGDATTGEHDIELAFAGSVFAGGAQVWEFAAVRTGPETAQLVTRITVAAGALTLVP